MALDIGQSACFTAEVDIARTAAALQSVGGPDLPPVFGTPFMVADMERACAELMRPLLSDGYVSVGVHIDIRHKAPTPIGESVTSTATFTKKDGALYWFAVKTEDAAGTVGEGRIARAIVEEDKMISAAEGRK